MQRSIAPTVAALVLAGALLVGCGSSNSAKQVTIPAFGIKDMTFTIAGRRLSVNFNRAAPKAIEVTAICADLGESGFERRVTAQGTLPKNARRFTVDMRQPVDDRDLCAIRLDKTNEQAAAFLKKSAEAKYLADHPELVNGTSGKTGKSGR